MNEFGCSLKRGIPMNENEIIQAIVTGNYAHPFSFLGMHKTAQGVVVRVFSPYAEGVTVLSHDMPSSIAFPLEKIHPQGFLSKFFYKNFGQ